MNKIEEAKRKLDDAARLSDDGEPLAALEQAASALADVTEVETAAYDEAAQAEGAEAADAQEAAAMEGAGETAQATEDEQEALEQ